MKSTVGGRSWLDTVKREGRTIATLDKVLRSPSKLVLVLDYVRAHYLECHCSPSRARSISQPHRLDWPIKASSDCNRAFSRLARVIPQSRRRIGQDPRDPLTVAAASSTTTTTLYYTCSTVSPRCIRRYAAGRRPSCISLHDDLRSKRANWRQLPILQALIAHKHTVKGRGQDAPTPLTPQKRGFIDSILTPLDRF